MIIELQARDLLLIAHFADRQHSNKVMLGATDLKHSGRLTPLEIHYIGAMGEFAVVRALARLGIRTHLDWEVRRGSDNGVDLRVEGVPCQVKTFTFTGRDFTFFVDSPESFTAERCYVCRVLSPCQVEVVGWISRDEFLARASERDFGYGRRLYVDEGSLTPLAEKPDPEGPGHAAD